MKQLMTVRFPITLAVIAILINIIGFTPALVDSSARTVPLPLGALDLVHVVVSGAWLLLFVVQAALIPARQTILHRRLGIVGVLLSALFIVVTWLMMVEGARRGFDLSGDLVPRGTSLDAGFFLAPVNALVSFGVLVAVAVWYRRRPVIHKRLMLLALLGTTGAPIAHTIGHWPALGPLALLIGPGSGLALLALVFIYDRLSLGRIHPVSLWAGLGAIAWTALFFVLVAPTPAWRRFAEWAIR